jgi:hypothetical protein
LIARSKPSRARGTAQRLAPHNGASCCRFLVIAWGTPGKTEGEFHLPHSIAIDPDGRLYVADRANERIQIFSPEGGFPRPMDQHGRAKDITRGKDGNFYSAEQEGRKAR